MPKKDNLCPSPVPASSERVLTNQIIGTPDGVELVADLYVPWGKPPFPAVIEITPYGSQRLSKLGEIYAARGFLFLAVDSRGRYRSSGRWEPLTHDQADGHAVIRWMAGHRLCNRRIGTRGHSYSGYNQLLSAIDAPSELQAMVVGVAPGDPFENVPFQGGAYDLNDLFWLLSMTGKVCYDEVDEEDFGQDEYDQEDENHEKDQDQAKNSCYPDREEPREEESDLLLKAALLARPFKDIDLRLGLRLDTFREWVSHWQMDDYWKARSVGHRLGRTAVPTLHISGWWDGNGRGSTRFFQGMRERASTHKAREEQRLLIGAWDHGLEAPDCGDLPEEEEELIERASLRDTLNDELAWFDWHLSDIKPGPATRSRVTLYLTGLHRWIEVSDWPPPGTEQVAYYLKADGKGRSGRLHPKSPPTGRGQAKSTYTFRPEDPTPFAHPDAEGDRMPFDNLLIEEERDDLLIFDTARMREPLVLIGELRLILYARADTRDFDLCAKLLDLYPDDRAIYLADGIIRARFRKGWDRPESVIPGETNTLAIDLWHIGHVVRPAHALRLEVSSAAFLRFDVNPCTGGHPAEETESRPAQVTIFHSADYPSRLMLPIHHGYEFFSET
ncbi:MAG: CocE/NonD family hydrolase [bacterium]